jgi:hypothetical protein
MSSFDYSLPDDWDDLPEEIKEQVTPEEWPRVRQGILQVRDMDRTLAEMTKTTTEAGVENGRMTEMAPLLDSLRRVRAVIDQAKSGKVLGLGPAILSALQDAALEAHTAMGEISMRNKTGIALMRDYMASLPQESLPPEIQEQVKEWLGGMREQILSELPLEMRKAVEDQDRKNRGL